MTRKIISIENLSSKVKAAKKQGKKIVHCHGVFDLLHIGHIKHFNEAKSHGDILIVTVTPDEYVHKGPNRPAFTTELRLEALAALESIDFVARNEWPTAIKTIEKIKPDIYFKGPDYKDHKDDVTGMIREESRAIEFIDGQIMYSTDITFSSSSILNRYSNLYSEEQKSFISKIRQEIGPADVKTVLEGLKDLKVLVIGETIIDQYIFCEALGKSGKEPVLVLRDLNTEEYLGGAAAITNHLADFCSSITLLSALGESGEYEDFIKANLAKNVRFEFINKTNSPTIVKKRFVEHITNSKTLGVYSINDETLSGKDEKKLRSIIIKEIRKHDLVIVTDYGHGLISEKVAEEIVKNSPYTTLNAQINAANSNYHTMDKYEKVECVIINEGELRHEFRNRDGDLDDLMKTLSQTLQAMNVVVTRGNQGAKLYKRTTDEFMTCPAFASKVVDKVGSGDAMLALLSASLRSGIDEKLSLLVGSLAAAQSVETIGNSQSVRKSNILKTLQHALK
jgi:rfaE bifunctional protein kinase chain/domain/rfaE bifunctional protein nucleotidyltransferase chain/domain